MNCHNLSLSVVLYCAVLCYAMICYAAPYDVRTCMYDAMNMGPCGLRIPNA